MEEVARAVARGIDAAARLPDPPELLGRALGPGPVDRDRFAEILVSTLMHYPPGPEELGSLDLAGLVAHAEANLWYVASRELRDARNPLIRARDAVLAEARLAEPSWHWAQRDPHLWRAEIALGRLGFRVTFWGRGPDAEWSQAWGGNDDTDRLLDHIGDLARQGRRVRTGLFPVLDRTVGAIIGEFIARAGPGSLRVDGLDARRNAHNLATYGAHAPEGWAVEPIRAPHTGRATADGVSGIRFVRLPVPAPRP